jgi:hypothetical protein
MLLGPWPAITNRVLTSERNRLLLSFGVLLAVNLALGSTFHYRVPWEKYAGYGGLLLVGAKILYTYVVYRVSRTLRQPLWMTAVYVVVAPIAGFELIPLVGLLVGVRMARGMLDEPVS